MKKAFAVLCSLLLAAAALCGCGGGTAAAPSPAPSPAVTPAPTPEPVLFDGQRLDALTESLTLGPESDLNALAALAPRLPALSTVHFGSREPKQEELQLLRAAFPGAELDYRVSVAGASFPWDAEELDLSSLDRACVEEAVRAVALLERLKRVDLGAASEEDPDALTLEDLGLFQAARPDVDFLFRFSLFGRELTSLDRELDFKDIPMDDEGAAVRAILPYMTRCTFLDMDSCGVSNEAMAAIRDDFPQMKVVWFVYFGSVYGARTDITKIFASYTGYPLTTESAENLKYFTDVRYLDIGHNNVDDISFVSYMPDLEVAVLALNPWTDCSPLANCRKLEYLEMFHTNCSDLSPLAGLIELRHLNASFLWDLEDLSPLYGLTGLERLWLGCRNSVSQEELDALREKLPNCEINATTIDPTGEGWRENERYDLLAEQMGYATGDYTLIWLQK